VRWLSVSDTTSQDYALWSGISLGHGTTYIHRTAFYRDQMPLDSTIPGPCHEPLLTTRQDRTSTNSTTRGLTIRLRLQLPPLSTTIPLGLAGTLSSSGLLAPVNRPRDAMPLPQRNRTW
jgi:hypothetical protein